MSLVLRCLLFLARCLLEPRDYERMVLPAVADAMHERSKSGSQLYWHAVVAHQLARIVGLASMHSWIEVAKTTRWWALLLGVLAGLTGSYGLRLAAPGSSFAFAQLVYVGIGTAVGICVAALPKRWFRAVGGVVAVLGGMAFILVPWLGSEYEGARRWLALGPLQVCVSTLLVPVFGAVLAGAAKRDRWGTLLTVVAVVQVLLVIQPDLNATLVYGVVALAVARKSWARLAVGLVSAIAAIAALLRNTHTAPLAHVEGAPGLFAHQAPLWFAVGLASMIALAVLGIVIWAKILRSSREGIGSGAELEVAAAASGLLSLLCIPWLLGDGGPPWMSYGGSAVVSAFALLGLIVRAERNAQAGRELGARN